MSTINAVTSTAAAPVYRPPPVPTTSQTAASTASSSTTSTSSATAAIGTLTTSVTYSATGAERITITNGRGQTISIDTIGGQSTAYPGAQYSGTA